MQGALLASRHNFHGCMMFGETNSFATGLQHSFNSACACVASSFIVAFPKVEAVDTRFWL